jgi:hypothetical protein
MRPQFCDPVRQPARVPQRALRRHRTIVHKIALMLGWPVPVPGDRVRAALAPRMDADMRAVAPDWRGR